MFDRAKIVDENFLLLIKNGNLPSSKSELNLSDTNFSSEDLISVFESQVISRHMDLKARNLKNEGKCFYTIGCSGHEGNAVFGKVFQIKDMAFLHYRSA
ncbi:MAG: MFS transporter, partial [Candidatus Marinimicrobia bacterium]|nr:MFS transporter [Candidatus Neomarinimicrobiota bacterium]